MTDAQLCKVRHAAAQLGVTPQTVRALIRSGRLSAVRLTPRGQWLVHTESLARLAGTPGSQDSREPGPLQ